LPRRLVLSGGFIVDDGCHRHLDQQARRLGFADLRACLQALLDDGWSIHQPPRRQQLARQRQRAAQQRAIARVAELGFEDMRAYLGGPAGHQGLDADTDPGELGAAPATLRHLLEEHGIRPVAPTRR
jgi:hypothetical protein